jgi:hypothetical protein
VTGAFKLAQDSKVVASEGSGAGDGYSQAGWTGYFAPSPSTAFKQRR